MAFTEALASDDPRYVDTSKARGSQQTLSRLARKFRLSLSDGAFYPTDSMHVLFFGHTGSGKSTELRQYSKQLRAALIAFSRLKSMLRPVSTATTFSMPTC
jgi:transcriptional regulator with AAA-type ATPase domain